MHASTPLPPLAAPGSTPRVIVEALVHRGELAVLELKEARIYAATTCLGAGFAAALVLLAGFAGTFTVAALVWNRADRGLILGLLTLAYVLGASALGWWAARRIREWEPLAELRRQLRKDCLCVHHYLTESIR